MELTVTLRLPDLALSPNARVHWAQKAAATRAYRTLAHVRGLEALGNVDHLPRWKRATARAIFYVPDRRRRDRDNLLASLKAAFDGFVDAGILEDDAGLTHLPVVIQVDQDNPRVEIRLSPQPGADKEAV